MKNTFLELLAAGAVALVFITVILATAATIKPNQPPVAITPTTPAATPAPATIPLAGQEFKTFKTWDEAKLFLAATGSANRYRRAYAAETTMPQLAGTPIANSADSSSAGSTDYSTTNVQVAGVDEDDTLKNDGKYIYTVTKGQIVIVDAFPATHAHVVTVLNDSNEQYQSIFVTGNRLVAFGSRTFAWRPFIEPLVKQEQSVSGLPRDIVTTPDYPDKVRYYSEQSQFMKIFDISDRSKPIPLKTIDSNGNLIAARLIGSRVYAVFNEYADYTFPRPLYAVNGETAQILPSDIRYIDYPFDNYQFTTVLGQDVDNPNNPESRTVVLTGGASTVYVSADNAYVAYTRYQTYFSIWDAYRSALEGKWAAEFQAKLTAIDSSEASDWLKDRMKITLAQQFLQTLNETQAQELYAEISKREEALRQSQTAPREATVVHKFILGPSVSYAGKGEAPGHLLNQFSMDESESYLRIATTVGEVWGSWMPVSRCMPNTRCIQPTPEPSKNNVYVLDNSLKLVGKLEDLAPGEKIYSTRFMGKRVYLVTFKKVDPLFVIGLEDPTNPTLLGKLKIPGYSDYLHPYDETHLIGLGKDAVPAEEGDFAWYQGVKLSLFDVSDVAAPKETATYSIGDRGTESYALHDHKAFLFSRERNLLVIPVNLAVIDKVKYPQGVTPQTYGDHVFQGAYVFTASLDGFTLRGTVSHADPKTLEKTGEYYFDFGTEVTRSAYIDNTLYTVSSQYVKANDLQTLASQASVELPQLPKSNYPPYWEGGVMAMPASAR